MTKILMPEIWLPKYKDIEAGATIGVWGELEWQLIDTGNFFRPTVVKKGKQKNLIVNAGLNGSKGLVGDSNWHGFMDVGTGTNAPLITDTALTNSILPARKGYSSRTDGRPVSENPALAYSTCTFRFEENEANGDLTEWATFYSSAGAMWCKELFRDENGNPVVVTKTNQQVLVLTYNCYWQRGNDNPAETVFNIDGVDYTFATLINNAQLVMGRLMPGSDTMAGTSNSPSNVIDVGKNLKGTNLGWSTSVEIKSYTTGSFVREAILTVNTDKWNGDIGEIIWTNSNANGYWLARTTITPVFTKTTNQKLYITFKRATVRV